MTRFVTVGNMRASIEQVQSSLASETNPSLVELKTELLARLERKLVLELEVADL